MSQRPHLLPRSRRSVVLLLAFALGVLLGLSVGSVTDYQDGPGLGVGR